VPGLAFATQVSADLPVVAERAMYFGGGQGGHVSAGAAYTSSVWHFAEGYTDFGNWFLLMNPNPVPAKAKVTFFKESGGPIVQTYDLKPTSRFTLYANKVIGAPETSFSISIEADQPIVAERSFYRAGSAAGYSAVGVAVPSSTWLLPDSSTAYPFSEYLLLANPGASAASVAITFAPESGAALTRTYTVAPASRLTIKVNDIVANAALSIRVDSSAPIVAERAVYFGHGGGVGPALSQ